MNSSHGNGVDQIIENCLKFNPDAWCMRSHSLFQSSLILYKIFKKFPQLKLDLSLFMHRAKYIYKKQKWEYDGFFLIVLCITGRMMQNFLIKKDFQKKKIFFSGILLF